jgi:Flp pilus assembly protein TadG
MKWPGLVDGRDGQRRRRSRNRRGSSVLDTFFVMTLLLGLSFGIVEYGYFFFVKHNLQAAAREGARAAILPGATSQNVTDAVTSLMKSAGLDKTGYSVSVTDTGGKALDVSSATAGTPIQVQVQCTWGSVGVHPLPESLGGISPAKVVKGATVMRKEG